MYQVVCSHEQLYIYFFPPKLESKANLIVAAQSRQGMAARNMVLLYRKLLLLRFCPCLAKSSRGISEPHLYSSTVLKFTALNFKMQCIETGSYYRGVHDPSFRTHLLFSMTLSLPSNFSLLVCNASVLA